MAAVPIEGTRLSAERPQDRASLQAVLLAQGEGCADGGTPYLRYALGIEPGRTGAAVLLAHDGRLVLAGTVEPGRDGVIMQLEVVEEVRGPLAAAWVRLETDGRITDLRLAFDQRQVRTARPVER